MKSHGKRFVWLACLLAAWVASASAQAAQTTPQTQTRAIPRAEEVLARVRAAVGYERLRGRAGGWVAEGRTRFRGLDSKLTLQFAPDGRFRLDIAGPLGDTVGFDGATAWEVDWSGMARVLELEDLEIAQYHAWVQTGRWLAEGGPFAVSLDAAKSDDKQVALRLALKGGLLEATVYVDRATWLPTKSFYAPGGGETSEFGDYREEQGFRLPHRVTRMVGGTTTVFEIGAIAPAPSAARARFERVKSKPADARWDASRPARVEMRRARTGHLLVHPLVEGKDVGWFILDSGAGIMVIDKKTADDLGMPALGEIVALGVGGMTKTRFRQGKTFTLGPLSMADVRYMELDLGFVSNSFGLPIAGICGRDLFARAVVEIDISNEAVSLHDPARYRLAGASWQELFFSGRNPAVRAAFEGHEGLFKLDTGSNQTVSFHTPAVERHQMLAGRETREGRSGGVGGALTSRAGKLAWFEFAGKRFEALDVEFADTREGAFSDIYTTGNIGTRILREFRIIFDYSNKRVAFAPAVPAAPAKAARPAGGGR